MNRLSLPFRVFCVIGVFAVIQQYRLLHYGPNDIGAGNLTYNLVGAKYGFPPPGTYVGSSSPPTLKLSWHIIAYKADPDNKGGIYTVGFMHTTQDGPKITKVQGQLNCHYDADQKAFTLLDIQTYASPATF